MPLTFVNLDLIDSSKPLVSSLKFECWRQLLVTFCVFKFQMIVHVKNCIQVGHASPIDLLIGFELFFQQSKR
jgi:hypothetical protein